MRVINEQQSETGTRSGIIRIRREWFTAYAGIFAIAETYNLAIRNFKLGRVVDLYELGRMREKKERDKRAGRRLALQIVEAENWFGPERETRLQFVIQ